MKISNLFEQEIITHDKKQFLVRLRNFKSPLRVALGVSFNRSSSHFVATAHVAKHLFWARVPSWKEGR